jgi:hypothetical protein
MGIIGTSGVIQASYSQSEYSATVPVIADYETTSLTKDSTSSAKNKVTYVQDNKGLVGWIENSSGSNITNKVKYNSTGTYTMDYSSASQWVGKDVHLNISTDIDVWETVETPGKWSPDDAF